MSLLGLDVGLTGCRALVTATDGTLLVDIGRGYDPAADLDACELDVRSIWAAVAAVLREAAQRTVADPIAGLAVSSVGEAIVPLARDGSVLAGCLLASVPGDEDVVSQLVAQLGQDKIYDITGQVSGRAHTITRLSALRREQPELYRSTWRFALVGSLVAHLLGANTTCDYSLAGGTLCFDMRQKTWSREILAACGLSSIKLPILAEAATPIGVISSRVAHELGLSARLTIVLGGHDLTCHALGVGAISHGMAALNLGASVHMTPVFHAIPLISMMLREGLSVEYHVVPNLLLADSYVRAGGSWLRWFSSEIAPLEQRETARRGLSLYKVLLDEMPAEPSPLLVRPPQDLNPTRAGSIQGLTLDTSRGELIKGMLEGIALQNALVQRRLEANGVGIDLYRATGGGSRTDSWVSLCSDVLGKPIERTTTQQSAALGAAILAGVGIGAYDDLAEGAKALVRVERVFEPDARRHRVYEERLQALDLSGGAFATA
ncbi:MAG: FGGY family carbohydrate kinase [Anaerolineae bacterium]